MNSVFAVVVAGGKGERMHARIPKQYLMLDDLPILTRTLLAFSDIPAVEKIYLAVPETDFGYCRESILPAVQDIISVTLVPGGVDRQGSVRSGLCAIPSEQGIVAIHDGVRPFVPVRQTEKAIALATTEGACILGIPTKDTLKKVDEQGVISETINRATIWQAQTPQVFGLQLIRQAHEFAVSTGFAGTDDASLVEHFGGRVRMIPGSPFNIKITEPEDLELARGILGYIDYRV
ncbi:MAG: 2-C-methyl-D-erythritol 4-phosphate cytidylyltransferase [Desulfobacterales bacterium]